MTDSSNIIPIGGPVQDAAAADMPADGFLANRAKLTNQLLRHCLVDSFHRFEADGKAYPFIAADHLLPSLGRARIEHRHQATVLMFMIDGVLPRPLNKHFRLRASNRVSWRNIQRLAPDLDLSDFKAAHCRLDEPGFADLLPRLLALDYALLAQRDADDNGMVLSHMHVKLERLTDTAIKELGKQLGYIERRLFERGEDYVEALEGKFFEYFGFSANAAGRKSAAAMAAQLLSAHAQRFTVFVAGQEDCRLTVLDDGPVIEQYLLIRPTGLALENFHLAALAAGVEDLRPYMLDGQGKAKTADTAFPLLYRLRLEHTAAAQPGKQPGERRHRDRDLLKPWLRVRDAAVLPCPEAGVISVAPAIPYYWAEAAE
ncbi:MAG: hypothetical protein QF384_02940 [Alphaproteobacteria bacterium]|nr:hypothetical protein [Alphaproteobacteria bacterium]MDP6830318.1 hypothetical protein [Alphaproteobacteria bacterium]MDP6875347.1 hypothetical protein [Alphaproteobacteria bacterium]